MMYVEKKFEDDKIYRILNNACCEIHLDPEKAVALLRKERRFRAQLLGDKDEKTKLIRSLFISFSKTSYDLIDLVIFSAITNVRIKFLGDFSYINEFIAVSESKEENFYLVYKSNEIFDSISKEVNVVVADKKLPNNIEALPADRILRRIRRHLLEQIKRNGLNPLPFFENSKLNTRKISVNSFDFKNSNFISNIYDDPVIIDEGQSIEMNSNNDDLQPITVNKSNFDAFYDIDGFHGFAFLNELQAFKELLELKYSKNYRKKPITKKRYLLGDGGSIKDLKNLFTVHFGEMCLPSVGGERINFFFCFDFDSKSLSDKQSENIREKIYDTLLCEIRDTLKTNRLKHCRLSFLKKNSCSQMTLQSDIHSDILDNDSVLSGKIDAQFIINVVKQLGEKIPNSKIIVFFEAYGTKNIFNDTSILKIVSKFNNFIDLSILNVDIDICCNVGIKGLKDKTLCCPEEFIDYKKYGINYYYLFNCSDFATFHGNTIKKSNKNCVSEYISTYSNGISKANIYVPLLTQYLPRFFRTLAFPFFTAGVASSDFYGWTVSKYMSKRLNKLTNQMAEARKNINDHMNLDIGIRAEFRISSVNIISFDAFSKKLFLNRELRFCETKKLISAIQKGLDDLLLRLNELRNTTIVKLANFGVREIFFFDKFIQGGSNVHILPSRVKENFLANKTKSNICDASNLEISELSLNESVLVVEKLFKYNKKLKDKDRKAFLKLLKFIELEMKDNLSNRDSVIFSVAIFEGLIDCFIRAIIKKYKVTETMLFHGSTESSKCNALPISTTEIIKQYFLSPSDKLCNDLYFGLYNYLLTRYSVDVLHDLIIKTMDSKNIKYFVKHFEGKGSKLRLISYFSSNTDEDFETKKRNIIAGIKKIDEERSSNNVKKRVKTLVSEHLLIYYGLHNDIYKPCNKKNLFDDTRYPFWMYTEKYKIENSYKTFKKVEKTLGLSFSEEMKNFDINKMHVENIVEYLNINNRFVESADIILSIDEIHTISRNKEFISQEKSYYENLFKWQDVNIKKSKDSFRFLLNIETDFINETIVDIDYNNYEMSNTIPDILLDNDFEVIQTEIPTPFEISVKKEQAARTPKIKIRSMTQGKNSKKKKLLIASESSDLVILESIYSDYHSSQIEICEKILISETNSSLVKSPIVFEKKNNIRIPFDNAFSIKTNQYLLLAESSLTFKADPNINPLFRIIPQSHMIITRLGKIALNIIKSRASAVSRKVFINYCKKDFYFAGIKFLDVLKLIEHLKNESRITIISTKERAIRIDISTLKY